MNATSFNPLAVARDLKAAGVEPTHADAIAEGMRQAAIADHEQLATKADMTALRIEMRIYGALTLAIAAKLFGIFDAVAAIL